MNMDVSGGTAEKLLPQLSINEVCQCLNGEYKSDILTDLDEKRIIAIRKATLKKGRVAFIVWDKNECGEWYDKGVGSKRYISVNDAVEAEAAAIISNIPIEDSSIPIIQIPLDMDIRKAWKYLNRKIRDKYTPITVAVTGNAGKTTTKDLISQVLSAKYNTLYVIKNYNTWRTVGEEIQNLNDDYEAYVQEVHEPDASLCSYMLKPDAVVITNIGRAHIEEVGESIEDMKKAVFGIADNMDEEGPVFLNNDCPILAASNPAMKHIIRYGTNNDKIDYWADHIYYSADENITSFVIHEKNGISLEAKINLCGIHNVANAVGAYAVGKYYNVEPAAIIESLASFQARGIRQRTIKTNNNTVIVDCYSVTELSMLAAARTLELYQDGSDVNRRILVLGYLPKIGNSSKTVHLDVAKQLVNYDIDEVICYRKDSAIIAEELSNNGKNAIYFEYHKDLIDYLKQVIAPGDVVMFKSGTAAHLEHVANMVFGLDLVPENSMEFDLEENGGSF